MKIDKKIIQELSDYLKEFNLNEIEITEKDTKIKVSKNNVSISNQPQVISPSSSTTSSVPTQTQNIKSGTEITSPIIGTAYHAPEPGAKKFVEIGKKIKKGETIMIVEAMKTMNHVPSTADGIVKEICVEDGQPVEFAQSNIEGELVNIIQDARKKFDGMIINAAAFTHTSVAIRDALNLFKKPIIELHLSNIYKREEFRHKSLISAVVTGGIFGLGADGYILAIISLQKTLQNENR